MLNYRSLRNTIGECTSHAYQLVRNNMEEKVIVNSVLGLFAVITAFMSRSYKRGVMFFQIIFLKNGTYAYAR